MRAKTLATIANGLLLAGALAAAPARSFAPIHSTAAQHRYMTARKPLKPIAQLLSKLCNRLPHPQFSMNAPEFSTTGFCGPECQQIRQKFAAGNAGALAPTTLVQAGVFAYDPLHGGIYNRREPVTHIIMHSTETARPADAQQIIHSWNNKGLRHAGAQFIVDRDGTIYMTLDPKYASVHVEPTRTIFGVNNDNSVGIEMVHTGDQQYTADQLRSVEELVCYLQQRFKVPDNEILAHATVQPSDRTDPVNFNWTHFRIAKAKIEGESRVALAAARK